MIPSLEIANHEAADQRAVVKRINRIGQLTTVQLTVHHTHASDSHSVSDALSVTSLAPQISLDTVAPRPLW